MLPCSPRAARAGGRRRRKVAVTGRGGACGECMPSRWQPEFWNRWRQNLHRRGGCIEDRGSNSLQKGFAGAWGNVVALLFELVFVEQAAAGNRASQAR